MPLFSLDTAYQRSKNLVGFPSKNGQGSSNCSPLKDDDRENYSAQQLSRINV